MRLRVEVLALAGVEPPLNNCEIARRAAAQLGRDVNVSTVRGIIERFGASEDPALQDAKRLGRKSKYGKRMRRCELCFLKLCYFFLFMGLWLPWPASIPSGGPGSW